MGFMKFLSLKAGGVDIFAKDFSGCTARKISKNHATVGGKAKK
jgi:hypothetical protein